MDTLVAPIVPAFRLSPNEVAEILSRLPKTYERPLFVYNDDEAALRSCLEKLERERRVRVLYIPFQVGKAEAVRRGLKMLLDMSRAEVIVQLDGHLKQPPEAVGALVRQLISMGSGMTVANRYAQQALEDQQHRIAITRVVSAIVQELTGYRLQDVVCGTRAYSRDLANRFLGLRAYGYGLEIEQILIASCSDANIAQWPVESNRQEGATSAEKIEDNLYALLARGSELRISDSARAVLSFMLAQIKERKTFRVDLTLFADCGEIQFDYRASADSVADGYSLSRTATEDGVMRG